MSKHRFEIILRVGAAGGDLTLLGAKSPNRQWVFFIERNETTVCDFLPEEDREGLIPVSSTPYLHSIEEALLSLGKYPWFKLAPMKIHSEFYDKILAEVKRLGGKSAVERWEDYLKLHSPFQLLGSKDNTAGVRDQARRKERKIVIYGHGDIRPGLGFPTDRDFKQWIKEDIFKKNRGRYHYTIGRDADVIVLSRNGLASGHFEIEGKVKPDQRDYKDYPSVKFVYVVRLSALYGNPVRLSDLGIKNIQYGKIITEAKFDEIRNAAGEVKEYRQ